MHSTSRDAGAAHDAGIHIVKLWIGLVPHLRLSSHALTPRPSRWNQPGMHVADLPPERRHIHNQVFDDREVAERRNLDVAVPFKFFAERGAACQFLAAVDRHRTRATNRDRKSTRLNSSHVAI